MVELFKNQNKNKPLKMKENIAVLKFFLMNDLIPTINNTQTMIISSPWTDSSDLNCRESA